MQKFTIPLFYFLLPNKLIFVELYPGARYQRDSSKFYLGASYQRNFNSVAVRSLPELLEKAQSGHGCCVSGGGRALINRQSLRLALAGSDMKLCGDS